MYKGSVKTGEGHRMEVALIVKGSCLMASSRARFLAGSLDGGDETPWQEGFVPDRALLALSGYDNLPPDLEGRKKVRRQIEDRLRKDRDYLRLVAGLL